MTSIYEEKISAEVRLIHAEQISLYKFHRFKKKQQTQLNTKQVKKDILNQWETMGFPKLIFSRFSKVAIATSAIKEFYNGGNAI